MPLSRFTHVLGNLLHRNAVERDLDEEMRFHVDALTEANMREGMSPGEARRQARILIGGPTQVKEHCREQQAGSFIEPIVQDVRYGWRTLLRNPGFSVVAILTLALGIGANSAIFTVINSVLIRPLPYSDPDRLVMIWTGFNDTEFTRAPASGPEWNVVRTRSEQLEDVGGIWASRGALTGDDEAEQIQLGFVTANFFQVLGATPQLGRLFLPEEQGPQAGHSILLSDELWRRRYGADDSIVGRTILLNGRAHIVIGVMPSGFKLMLPADSSIPTDLQAWVPFEADLAAGPPDLYYLRLVARRKATATPEQVQAELDGLATRLEEMYTQLADPGLQLNAVPLHADTVRSIRPALLALFVAVGLVLLLTCANVANLLIARATRRSREMAIRAALGASRWRMIRQLLCESLLLSFLGGGLGLFVGWWGLDWLLIFQTGDLARIDAVGIDWRVLGFTALIAVGSGILFGLAPVFSLSHLDLCSSLKDGTGNVFKALRLRTPTLLVAGEVALGFVLLVGAGLLVRTYLSMHAAPIGFQDRGVMTFQIQLPNPIYPDDDDRAQFARLLEERLRSIPGVEAVGAIHRLPLDDAPNWSSPYYPEGATDEEKATLLTDNRAVTPGFFEAVGASLVEGRMFTDLDVDRSNPVVIVDDTLARRHWPGQSAVGKRINIGLYANATFPAGWAEIVGVVNHIHHHSLTETVREQVYLPHTIASRPELSFVLRTSSDPDSLTGPVRRAVAELNPNLPIAKARPLSSYVDAALATTRFTMLLAGLFALMAGLMAAIGIYGIIAYAVQGRTSEIGLRIALGAGRFSILRTVLKQGLPMVLGGLGIGLVVSLSVSRALATLLYGVGPNDLLTYLAIVLGIVAVAGLAILFPARRAMNIDPMVALRTN